MRHPASGPRRQIAHTSTSWNDASWYVGMVGARGHQYHRHLALPALLDLLHARPGERVLDVGCGPGVPARPLARLGVTYTGLDLSPHMICEARRQHGAHGRFRVGDARHLRAECQGDAPYDAVTFLFSLQDMQPLDTILREAAGVLRPGGALVAVLTHPCFRVPRHSGWGWDGARKLHHRRIDRYLSALSVPSGPPHARTLSFHRPLQDYVHALFQAGLSVEALRELPLTPALQRRAEVEGAPVNPDIPTLLALRARKGPA